jgi:hypothetical protein
MIQKIPRFFIFNMDETGVDDWVDSHDVLVAIPRQDSDSKISIPIQRRSKRATLTACIAADGSAIKPLLIMSTGSIIEDIEEAGFTKDKVQFIFQNHGFMTKRIFHYWCTEIFFPYVEMKREENNYHNMAVLLMDQFSGHTYEGFEEDCRNFKITSRPLILHTSHLAQPLDQIIFSEFKRRFSHIRYDKCFTAASNRLIRILKAWFQTITADLITSTFTAAGIVPEREQRGGFYCCKIDLTRSIHMKELKAERIPEIAPPRVEDPKDTDPILSGKSHVSSEFSHSAPGSPAKPPQKRVKIVNLEHNTKKILEGAEFKSSQAVISINAQFQALQSAQKQLTLVEMLQKKTKKLSDASIMPVPPQERSSDSRSFETPPE